MLETVIPPAMIAAAISANHFELFILPSHTPRAAEMLQEPCPGQFVESLFGLRPCIGAMNPLVLVLVLVLEDKPLNRERGRGGRRGRNGGSWKAWTSFLPCIGTMNPTDSPSAAVRAPSPPLGEKDGMRGLGSWKVVNSWRERVEARRLPRLGNPSKVTLEFHRLCQALQILLTRNRNGAELSRDGRQ